MDQSRIDDSQIAAMRMQRQRIAHSDLDTPEAVVRWMGAMQAQDYRQALWGIGARLPGSTVRGIEQAIADARIIRTWAMRGTIHFVPAEDAKWMVRLMAARMLEKDARRQSQLGLDAALLARCDAIFATLLEGGKRLTRSALLAGLEAEGIPVTGQRGYHILWYSGQTGTIAITQMDDKEQTFGLLDEIAPDAPPLTADEALAEMARRYFRSHAPATPHDLAWWTGLTVTEARWGIAMLDGMLHAEKIDGVTYWYSDEGSANGSARALYLLPGFDEYLLGYQNRAAVLDPQFAQQVCPGSNGVFYPMMVAAGRIIGTWKRVFRKRDIAITQKSFAGLSDAQSAAFITEAQRFSAFWGLPAHIQ